VGSGPRFGTLPGKLLLRSSKDLKIGAALVKWPKYFFLLITMKLASLVEIAMLIIYYQGTKENF
jgi:hypothetical protein